MIKFLLLLHFITFHLYIFNHIYGKINNIYYSKINNIYYYKVYVLCMIQQLNFIFKYL